MAKRIKITAEKGHAWCEMSPGVFLFGRSAEDVKTALDAKARHDRIAGETETETAV